MALASPYDPYSSPNYPTSSQSASYTKTSPYVNKNPMEYLFSIPHNINQDQAPGKIAKTVFPPNFHYQPTETFKTLKYYQAILMETKSISIKPILSKTHENKILYHSLHIEKFLTETEWGLPLYQLKPFHSQSPLLVNASFNYHDYIQAWTNIFLHQTEDFSHSWFITFDRNFRMNFPAWFPKWWSAHGLTASLLPEELMSALSNGFQQKFDRSRFHYRITLLPLFMAKYKIPWIMKWNYEVETSEVYRQRAVKWWDKFDIERIITLVQSEFPPTPVPAAIPAQPVQALPAQSKKALPIIPEQSLSDISPSSSLKGTTKSSKSTSSKKKEKSAQMKDLAQQLMAEAALLQNEDDSDSNSSDASSQHPTNPASQKTPWADYQDSQDPFDL